MAIYDNFPYTNIHEMNLRWIIEQVKQGNLTIEDFAEQLAQFDEDYATLSALAAAFTIAGSNISTTKNFSAASLAGPLTGNVTGNVTGNLTGNVTGNVTGDVTGNADTSTYATSAGSATTATTADGLSGTASINTTGTITASGFSGPLTGNVTGNVTGNLTGNVTGDVTGDLDGTALQSQYSIHANYAVRLIENNGPALTSVDADDYLPTDLGMVMYKTPALTTHVPTGMESEHAIILGINTDIGSCAIQVAWFPAASTGTYVRVRVGATWQSWTTL